MTGLGLVYAARSDVGLRREGNEDSVYAGPRLLVVADGMGGHAAGEVASAVAVAHLARLDEDVPGSDLLAALRRAVEGANEQLADMVTADDHLEGMGTTVTGLLVDRGRVALVHVGDSRAYLLREGEFTQISHDHTLVQSLVDDGEITSEEAETHPQRSLLLKALDGRDGVDPDLSVREAREGDRYLLCSDGLSGVVSAERLCKELMKSAEPSVVVDRLVDLALRGGAPDNVTVVVADVVADRPGLPLAPVVGGAATDAVGRQAEDAASRSDSPAVRAARAARAAAAGGSTAPIPADASPPAGGRRTRAGRWATITLAVLLVGLLLAAGGVLWLRGQWYVGEDDGRVAVFNGIDVSAAGLTLSSVDTVSELPVDALPGRLQERLAAGIPADDREGAVGVVQRLGDAARSACEDEQARIRAERQAEAAPSPSEIPLDPTAPLQDGASPSPDASPGPAPDASPAPAPEDSPGQLPPCPQVGDLS